MVSSEFFSRWRGLLILSADILLFVVLLKTLPFAPAVVTGLSILVFIAILWLTEAVHVSITALLVPVLAVSFGIFKTPQALSNFADPIIFLFLGPSNSNRKICCQIPRSSRPPLRGKTFSCPIRPERI